MIQTLTLLIGALAVLLAYVVGKFLERVLPDYGRGIFPETPPEVVAWREEQDRLAARRSS